MDTTQKVSITKTEKVQIKHQNDDKIENNSRVEKNENRANLSVPVAHKK